MAGAPPADQECRALLSMARDNKHQEIAAAVRLGMPVDWANAVRVPPRFVPPHHSGRTARMRPVPHAPP